MILIAKRLLAVEKVEIYFGVNQSSGSRPFVLGGESADLDLPPIAKWGAASTFGLDNFNEISGSYWGDWKSGISKVGCDWVIPIIEHAIQTGHLKNAVEHIIKESQRHSVES